MEQSYAFVRHAAGQIQVDITAVHQILSGAKSAEFTQ
jgi:hypothetical protein